MFSLLWVQTRRQWRRHALKQPLMTSSLITVALQHNNMHVRDISTNTAQKSAVVLAVLLLRHAYRTRNSNGQSGPWRHHLLRQCILPVYTASKKVALSKDFTLEAVKKCFEGTPTNRCHAKERLNCNRRKRGLTRLHLLQTYYHFYNVWLTFM